MKLVIFSHFFAPSIGGVENITMSLARGLAKRGSPDGKPEFDITLVTETPADAFDDGVLPFRVVRQPKFQTLWRLLRNANIVHLAGPALVPLLVAWLLRKPAVIEHHTYQAICPNGRLVHEPDRAVCPGHFQAGHFAECVRCQANEISWPASLVNLLLMFPRYLLTRAAARNIAVTQHVLERHALPHSSVIYHGIEDSLNGSARHRPASTCSAPGTISFAYVGRFVSEKGIPILLAASKILANEGRSFTVQLIGDGPERPKVEEIIRREGLGHCVRITGYLTGMPLAEALCEVDAVVLPSVCEETAGLSLMEQMMRGTAVIASDIGGLAEVVGDAGLKFAPGDDHALAACMRKVLKGPSLIDALGEEGRKRARLHFARERMIEEHAKVYHHVLSRIG
jgi:glycosyltransferase involved in cell wall biosynthesis